MSYHTFTIGGSTVRGFRVSGTGEVQDFEGTLNNSYRSLARASGAARRKYRDSTITITDIESVKKRYRVDFDQLMTIAEEY